MMSDTETAAAEVSKRTNNRKAPPVEPLAHSVDETARILSIGRDKVYGYIKDEKLVARKLGKRTVITRESIVRLLDGSPSLAPTPAA